MALQSNTFTTFDAKGIREDLSDVIYNVDPVDTPFLSTVPHVGASNTLHEWQVDSLVAASSTGTGVAALEGDDAPQLAVTATVRRGNYCQISTKDARVSGTQRSVNTAGRADELAYQMLKRGKELKRDMESVLLANQARNAGTEAVARKLAGLPAWIATNTSKDTDGSPAAGADPTGDGTDARTDNSNTRVFAEADLKTVVRDIFDSGGKPDILMVGAFNRQKVSGFGTETSKRVQMQRMEDKVLHTSFEVYESDFSPLKVVPNRFQRARDAFALQMDMWAVAYLTGRNMVAFDIAKTGDSDARQILSEYTLEARNEKASGGVFDLTSA